MFFTESSALTDQLGAVLVIGTAVMLEHGLHHNYITELLFRGF